MKISEFVRSAQQEEALMNAYTKATKSLSRVQHMNFNQALVEMLMEMVPQKAKVIKALLDAKKKIMTPAEEGTP